MLPETCIGATTEVVVQPMPDILSESGYEQVAWVKVGKQTVAFRFDGYRHVITPDMNNGWYNPDLGEDHSRLFTPVKGTEPTPVDSKVRVSELPPYASTPEEMAAWKAWCAGEDITEEQFVLVVGTRLPPDAPFPCDDFHRPVWQKELPHSRPAGGGVQITPAAGARSPPQTMWCGEPVARRCQIRRTLHSRPML